MSVSMESSLIPGHPPEEPWNTGSNAVAAGRVLAATCPVGGLIGSYSPFVPLMTGNCCENLRYTSA